MTDESLLTKLMMNFHSEEIVQAVGSMLHELQIEDESIRLRVEDYFRQRVERVVQAFNDVCIEGDESELIPMVKELWLEIRFEWNRYNCQMQYQCVKNGVADPTLMAIAAMTSDLLSRLQEVVSPCDAFWLNKLGASPFDTAQLGARINERVIELTTSAHYAAEAVMEELETAQEFVISHTTDTEVARMLQEATADSVALISNNVTLSTADLHLALESCFLEHLKASKVYGVFSRSMGNDNIVVPPLIGAAIRDIANRWFLHLFTKSIESSTQQRINAGKSAHVTTLWKVEKNGSHLQIVLSDDGLGVPGADLQLSFYSNLGMRAEVKCEPGNGSELSLDFDLQIMGLTAVREYMVFTINPEGKESRLALCLSDVETLLESNAVSLVDSLNSVVLRSGEVVPAVDAQEFYFGDPITFTRHLYLILKNERGQRLALKANAVDGVLRGRMTPHELISGGAVVGFLPDRQGAVTVIGTSYLFNNVAVPLLMSSNREESIC